jgi:glycerol-3-phosphate dehydrogenase
MLFVVPWEGLAVVGTSHSRTTCGPDDTHVTEDELAAFIGEVNEAFPAFRLTADDVTLVHRGVVPAAKGRRGDLALEGHTRLRDHARDGVEGALSLFGVKFTTGRGVAEEAIDAAVAKLGRHAPCRTADRPLPGAVEDPEALAADAASSGETMTDLACLDQLIVSYGSTYSRVLEISAAEPSLAAPVAAGVPVLGAQIAHAVRHEMAQTLVDAVVRRVPLGSARHPGAAVAASCAAIMARELGWSESRTREEVDALRRFYEPVRVAG